LYPRTKTTNKSCTKPSHVASRVSGLKLKALRSLFPCGYARVELLGVVLSRAGEDSSVSPIHRVIKSRQAKMTFRLRKHSWDSAFLCSLNSIISRPKSLHRSYISARKSFKPSVHRGTEDELLGGDLVVLASG
jgi:hypothetical protein